MHIPDPIERGERRCEDWESNARVGDKYRCGCGRLFDLKDGMSLSPDPYAIPVCPRCVNEWFIKTQLGESIPKQSSDDLCEGCATPQSRWDTKTMTTEEYVAAYRKQFE